MKRDIATIHRDGKKVKNEIYWRKQKKKYCWQSWKLRESRMMEQKTRGRVIQFTDLIESFLIIEGVARVTFGVPRWAPLRVPGLRDADIVLVACFSSLRSFFHSLSASVYIHLLVMLYTWIDINIDMYMEYSYNEPCSGTRPLRYSRDR